MKQIFFLFLIAFSIASRNKSEEQIVEPESNLQSFSDLDACLVYIELPSWNCSDLAAALIDNTITAVDNDGEYELTLRADMTATYIREGQQLAYTHWRVDQSCCNIFDIYYFDTEQDRDIGENFIVTELTNDRVCLYAYLDDKCWYY